MPFVARKDPGAVGDFTVDWSPYLGDDSINTSLWTGSDGIVVDDFSHSDPFSTVWYSGGSDGGDYELVNRITTVGGRTEDDTLVVRVRRDPSEDFPIPSDLKKGVFSEGGGLTDDDLMEMIRGWEARVAAANGGILENEPFARSVVRQGAKAQFEGEVLRMSGRIDDGRRTFAESRAEAVMTSYLNAKKEARADAAEPAPASVHNVTEEPLF